MGNYIESKTRVKQKIFLLYYYPLTDTKRYKGGGGLEEKTDKRFGETTLSRVLQLERNYDE